MKKIFALGVLLFGVTPIFAQEKQIFPDVPPNHWAFSAVQRLAKQGILQGYPAVEVPTKAVSPVLVQSKPESLESPLRVIPLIKTELGATAELRGSRIDVDTNSQTRQVFLRGVAVSQYQKALAGQIARKYAKGYTIVNELRVSK